MGQNLVVLVIIGSRAVYLIKFICNFYFARCIEIIPYASIVALQPLPETVALAEDIVVEYVTDMASL